MGKSIMINGHTNPKEKEDSGAQSHHESTGEADGDDGYEKPAYPTIEKRRSSPYTDEQVYAPYRAREPIVANMFRSES
jgi:hypothetical protein